MKTNDSLLIVIATYNEIDNLPRLVRQLESLLPAAEILVIDDASPDGTGKWCDEGGAQHARLAVIHREKKSGLGAAAIVGFKYAIEHRVRFVATMDADFSHDPESLVDLVKCLQTSDNREVGVAIGSRYISGGSTVGWPLFRRIASRSVNAYARLLLGLKTKDNSGAFRVYRTSDLARIELESIRSQGYGYLEEILWRLRRAGVAMVELPICFRDRERGLSKTSLLAGLNVFWQITKMGLGRWK